MRKKEVIESRAWEIIGHFIDLQNIAKGERIQALNTVLHLTEIMSDMQGAGALDVNSKATRLLDQMIIDITDRKDVFNKPLFPPQ